jgi:hypothetical protein
MGATKHIECPKGTIENSHVGSGNVAGGEASIGKRNDTSLQQPLPLTTPQSVLVTLLSQRIPRAGWFLCQATVALRAPYMHNARPSRSLMLLPIQLTDPERLDLVVFMETLNGDGESPRPSR